MEKAIESGAALAKFKEFVEAQGGDGTYIDDVNKIPARGKLCSDRL